jgi:catechol 2,3-dioxygenase-like lactoylglutathione lyase family enzyme
MEPTIATRECLAITGVSHIELHVSDLEASTEWYKAAVGLAPIQSAPGKYSQLAPEGGSFRLGLTQTDPAEVHGQFGHLAIALESMDVLTAWVDHLDAIGTPHTAIKENPFRPGVFSIDIFDPDGHEIELIYEP